MAGQLDPNPDADTRPSWKCSRMYYRGVYSGVDCR